MGWYLSLNILPFCLIVLFILGCCSNVIKSVCQFCSYVQICLRFSRCPFRLALFYLLFLTCDFWFALIVLRFLICAFRICPFLMESLVSGEWGYVNVTSHELTGAIAFALAYSAVRGYSHVTSIFDEVHAMVIRWGRKFKSLWNICAEV